MKDKSAGSPRICDGASVSGGCGFQQVFHVAGMEERESERGESMFSFGCCLPGGPFDAGQAHRLAAMGFAYGEIAAAPLAAMTNEEFAALRREQQVGGLPIQAANCFLPGELSLFAPDQKEKLRGHVERVLHRAADLGIDTVVFGSGGARRIPKDTPREVGEDVIADFLTLCSRFCAQTGEPIWHVLERLCVRLDMTDVFRSNAAGNILKRRWSRGFTF